MLLGKTFVNWKKGRGGVPPPHRRVPYPLFGNQAYDFASWIFLRMRASRSSGESSWLLATSCIEEMSLSCCSSLVYIRDIFTTMSLVYSAWSIRNCALAMKLSMDCRDSWRPSVEEELQPPQSQSILGIPLHTRQPGRPFPAACRSLLGLEGSL